MFSLRTSSVIDMAPPSGLITELCLSSVQVISGRGRPKTVQLRGTRSVWLTIIETGLTVTEGGSERERERENTRP